MEYIDAIYRIAGILTVVCASWRWARAWVARRGKTDPFPENYASCVQVDGLRFH
jgi:hypothetical protein